MIDESLYEQWLRAKDAERFAQERRREIEDRLIAEFGVTEGDEQTQTVDEDQYRIKITSRVNRSVNTEKLREIAVDNGLEEHLDRLFRWKAELSLTAWRNSDPAITAPLAEAITAKPGRPSFSIERKSTKE